MQDYVEKRDGGYYVTGSRVALDSIVIAFQRGASPESIMRSLPTLGSLVKVYGALTFYLENQAAVDQYLREQEMLADHLNKTLSPMPAAMAERIRLARLSSRQPA